MVDVVLVAADTVGQGTNGTGTAGETLEAGECVRIDTAAANKLKLADASLLVTDAAAVGIMLNNCSDGQPADYIKAGLLTVTAAALTIGKVYVVSSAAPGGIAPEADLGAGDFPTVLGIAVATNQLLVGIVRGSAAKA